ncbi:hypothetical protein DFH07DRAFT_816410, partial [Mycena maculata]
MQLSIWGLIKGQFKKQPPVVNADLTGKTVLVLGASAGLGLEAAKRFARMNPGRLILACRNQSKGQAAADTGHAYIHIELKADTGYKNAELWIIDLADFDSVRRFADKFDKEGGRLDILVENAAVAKVTYEPTKDGWESSLQVNCLSTPLVAILLLPHMMRTAQEHSTVPRTVVHASIPKRVLESGNIRAAQTAARPGKIMRASYMVTKPLNERLGTAPLIVNAVHPGFCVSELRRDLSGPAMEGGRRLVHGAVGMPENPDKLRGEYLNYDFEISQKAQDQIWDELVETLGKVDPRVLTVVNKYLARDIL